VSKVLLGNNEAANTNQLSSLYERSVEVSEKTQVLNAKDAGEYIKKLSELARREYGDKQGKPDLNQTDYARELNVSKATIQAWESGRNFPKATYIAIMAWHIGATADEVLRDLTILDDSKLEKHIPQDLSNPEFSIPGFMRVLALVPNDVLLQVHRKVLDIMNTRFQKWVGGEKNNDLLNGET
jgi:DNA-binding transcriptional regulator YiaG